MQETRHFHEEVSQSTRPGRIKETAEDYRYFPEPDLVPIAPSREWVEQLRATLPELPWERNKRLKVEWRLSDEEFRDLVNAGALDLIVVHCGRRRRRRPRPASWWVAYLTQQANDARRRTGRAADHPGPGGPGRRAGRATAS